ncbi:hypothetical protein QYF36_011886 [Acer negundo]|nr:hypothetical protein QYF36_011886 [Acer negundo]
MNEGEGCNNEGGEKSNLKAREIEGEGLFSYRSERNQRRRRGDDGVQLEVGSGHLLLGGDGYFGGCGGHLFFWGRKVTSELVVSVLVCEADSSEFVVGFWIWEADRSELVVGNPAGNLVWEADRSELVVGTAAGDNRRKAAVSTHGDVPLQQ